MIIYPEVFGVMTPTESFMKTIGHLFEETAYKNKN